MTKYEDLGIFREGYSLVLIIYDLTAKFPDDEKQNIISQIKRASVSIPLNIADGSSRFSKRAFLQFLNYSYGSCKELEVLFSLSRDLNYVNVSDYVLISEKINKISRMIYNFCNVLSKDVKNVNFDNMSLHKFS